MAERWRATVRVWGGQSWGRYTFYLWADKDSPEVLVQDLAEIHALQFFPKVVPGCEVVYLGQVARLEAQVA